MFTLEEITYLDILKIPRLDIPDSGITCLFGPSGCGKTTTMRLLNGMISPTSGRVLYRGRDLDTLNLVEHRREVVQMSQGSILFPGNVRDNLNIGAEFQCRLPFSDASIREILSAVGLDGKSPAEDPRSFSGGEKQRLSLARVLLLQPEVLLLDEPASALDADTEDSIMELVRCFVLQRKMACVLVTHSEEMARGYSDRIVYMKEGQVLRVVEQTEADLRLDLQCKALNLGQLPEQKEGGCQ